MPCRILLFCRVYCLAWTDTFKSKILFHMFEWLVTCKVKVGCFIWRQNSGNNVQRFDAKVRGNPLIFLKSFLIEVLAGAFTLLLTLKQEDLFDWPQVWREVNLTCTQQNLAQRILMTSDNSPAAFSKWWKLFYKDGTHSPLHGKTGAYSYLQHYRKTVSCSNTTKCEKQVNENVLQHFVWQCKFYAHKRLNWYLKFSL